jgi:hypothetical protein
MGASRRGGDFTERSASAATATSLFLFADFAITETSLAALFLSQRAQ